MNHQLLRGQVAIMFCFFSVGSVHAKTIDTTPRPAVLLSASNQFIAQDAWNSAALFNSDDKTPIRQFKAGNEINELQVTVDEQLLLIACESGDLGVWNITTGEKLWWKTPRQTGLGFIYGAAFSADGKFLVACNTRDFAVVFNSLNGEAIGKVTFPPWETNIMSAALLPGGTKGAFIELGGRLFTFETQTGQMTDTFLTGASPVRYSINGKYIALRSTNSGVDEQLRVVAVNDLQKKDVGQFSHIGHVKPTQNSGFLVTALIGSRYDEKAVTVGVEIDADLGTLKEVWRLPIAEADNCTDFDVRRMIGVSTDYRLVTRLIDLRTGKPRLTIDNSANYRERLLSFTSADFGTSFPLGVSVVGTIGIAVMVWGFVRFWKGRTSR